MVRQILLVVFVLKAQMVLPGFVQAEEREFYWYNGETKRQLICLSGACQKSPAVYADNTPSKPVYLKAGNTILVKLFEGQTVESIVESTQATSYRKLAVGEKNYLLFYASDVNVLLVANGIYEQGKAQNAYPDWEHVTP